MGKIKIILFDIDGVLIRLPYYFSRELTLMGYDYAENCLDDFFHSDSYSECLQGKKNVKVSIAPYLEKSGWKGTIDDYLAQQFKFEIKYLDRDMLSIIKSLKVHGVKCLLSTDQEKVRCQYLLGEAGLGEIFDGNFVSSEIGFRKYQDGFWENVIKRLREENEDVETKEIAFFDDKQRNIDVAQKFGIRAFLFKNTSEFKRDIDFLKLRVD
ncbi:MAG: HAD family hydrolase [Candidatus Paceibacterota bacterium]